jgi:hypothetical protein
VKLYQFPISIAVESGNMSHILLLRQLIHVTYSVCGFLVGNLMILFGLTGVSWFVRKRIEGRERAFAVREYLR